MDLFSSQCTNIINNTTNIYNINTFTYIKKHFKNVESLENIKNKNSKVLSDMLKFSDQTSYTQHSIEEIIVYHVMNNIFHQLIGDEIVKEFKKENPAEQQFWSSDISRLSFIVRKYIKECEDVQWERDIKGEHLTSCIITPLLEEIYEIMNKYNKQLISKIIIDKSIIEIAKPEILTKIDNSLFNTYLKDFSNIKSATNPPNSSISSSIFV
jgi:hypothetical protein